MSISFFTNPAPQITSVSIRCWAYEGIEAKVPTHDSAARVSDRHVEDCTDCARSFGMLTTNVYETDDVDVNNSNGGRLLEALGLRETSASLCGSTSAGDFLARVKAAQNSGAYEHNEYFSFRLNQLKELGQFAEARGAEVTWG